MSAFQFPNVRKYFNLPDLLLAPRHSVRVSKGDAIPLLSILLVNYNGRVHLNECLSSIRSQDFLDYEIIMVDNGSVDQSIEWVASNFPDVIVADAGSNLGFAGGNNFGLQFCNGAYIFFLNNDTVLEPGALRNLASAISDYSDTNVFACLMLKYSNPTIVDNAGETIYRIGMISGFSGYPASCFSDVREVIGACGGAAVYARSILNEIGGFDECFFLLFEDVDLSLRARHHGERILFLPSVRVRHKGSASIGGSLSPTAVFFSAQNFFSLILKNVPLITILTFIPGIVLSMSIRGLQTIRQGLFGTYLRGLYAGIRLLPRAIRQRRSIFLNTRIERKEFERLLRPHWVRERFAFKRGNYDGIP